MNFQVLHYQWFQFLNRDSHPPQFRIHFQAFFSSLSYRQVKSYLDLGFIHSWNFFLGFSLLQRFQIHPHLLVQFFSLFYLVFWKFYPRNQKRRFPDLGMKAFPLVFQGYLCLVLNLWEAPDFHLKIHFHQILAIQTYFFYPKLFYSLHFLPSYVQKFHLILDPPKKLSVNRFLFFYRYFLQNCVVYQTYFFCQFFSFLHH